MTQIYNRPLISPLHERASLYEPKQDHYTAREFQSSERYSSNNLGRPYEGGGWKLSQPRSPMSDSKKGLYEVPPTKEEDMFQTRPDASQKPPREQLPPLSSLFGSASHQPRPAQSPYSDRHSPVFPTVSPREARHPTTPIHPDRPYESSYFPRPPPSRQYSYGSRPEQSERLGFQPPPRPVQTGVRPESPRYESKYGPVDVGRGQQTTSVNGWSPRPQANRPDYFLRDTSSSFRPVSDQQRPPPPTHRSDPESRPSYRDGHHSAPVTPNYPPTPASTVAGDPSTTKDGLGPKIWTGTQFLPRFVRQAEVPGEGMCYFYDDGTHCKTVIDGEVVNAHWGVTKAGKPRKRLAIACITCREKKIKCDPDYPRCVQCEKFGRVCKFKNAPRGGQGSPDTPPADSEDLQRPPSSRTDTESFRVEKREGSHSVSPRQTLRHATPDSETHPAKRQRNGYNDFTPVASESSPHPSVQETTFPATPWNEPLITGTIDHALLRDWQVNPYTSHPALVTDIISVFFRHVPETVSCIFPEGFFKSWVLSPSEKSLDDLMLIYTILALGTIFSPKAEHKPLGSQYAAISRYACGNRHFSIQLVQSRLLLALYYFAINNPNDSWDFCGAAMRAASGLKLNLEFEKSEDAYLQTFPYGLNRHGYAECRRRTFWSCYLMDRYNGFCSGHISVIHPEDVFLRLPCDAKSFESQVDVQNPFFDPTTPPIQNVNWTIGTMAYLINISTIWGDVMANIYRTSQRPISTRNPNFTAFYETMTQRLRAWNDSLPSCYAFSAENLKRASDSGKLGIFMTMHSNYHTTAMKLNRYIAASSLTTAQLTHHVSVAKQHAESLLGMMDTLAARRTSAASSPIQDVTATFKFSSPFVGYAIVSAIDILTAKITIPSIPSRLASFAGPQSILGELAYFWQSAKNQQALVAQRVRELSELANSKEEMGGMGFKFGHMGVGSGEGVFEMRDAIEKTFSRDYDCVYA